MSQLKISADTSEVKKSILDLSRNLKNIGSSKIAIFTAEDKRFMKTEMKKELDLMKQRLSSNRAEIKKMIEDQKKLVQGSKEELEVRKKILEAYQTQSKLSKEHSSVQSASKSGAGGGGILSMLTGEVGGFLGGAMSLLGGGALAAGALGIAKGIQGTNQYVGGASNRVRLKGLGVNEDNFGSADQMAKAGVTEQDLINRRINATSVLGRQGSSNADELQKASFERAYGLQGGTMTGVAGSLRSNFGGQGANEAQVKLQASIMASGIEDALGPYLESMTSLLSSINDNGVTNTGEVTNLMAQLTKDSGRTPEQLGRTFSGINSAITGASGEQSAFFQNAFAKAGIGGGTIGGTKQAMEGGGLFGLNPAELMKQGYNPELLKNMGGAGMFTGVGARGGAVLDQFKASMGMGSGQSISGITDMNSKNGITELGNKMFNTKGEQGYQALMMLEKVQNKQMGQKDFEDRVKKMQESKDPQVERLDKVNSSLAGQTDILTNIDNNLAEAMGKQGVQIRNQAKEAENTGTQAATGVVGAVNDSGATKGIGGRMNSALKSTFSGDFGGQVYDWLHPNEMKAMKAQPPPSEANASYPTAKDIGSEVADALKKAPIQTSVDSNVTIKGGMSGSPSNRTYK